MPLISCPKCNSVISNKADYCPHCGNNMHLHSYRIETRPYVKSPIPESHHPKSWLTESLLLGFAALILFTIWCLPFAIASFINANRVESLWRLGDIDGAERASEQARKYFMIGLWLGIITWVLALLVFCLIFIGLLNILN